ncbi:TolB family protein [Yoonia sediminilitoris]|uniref:WD40 repeat protein n=1 Tax=Yoonia sediminilitoris TaxID=1286148 RepID=A0A2T6KPT8_9RHOB|nr:PD40 domain-containing protein [Yoonia sediminilitoris]PUB18586.1 WD40 repeat protein [Yoonia sediminilitoris]RCW98754.1 WD40 repeat protein [Yoonia sediminilitoris]
MQSELCLFDMARGEATVLLRHDGHIEAPNWHPDGYLIVNGDGRLFRVPLAAPALHLIDTGHATACNNDHGISPDGSMLVISDKSRTESSCIYSLPVTGGVPVRVTDTVPSYWHGWAPDGQRLAYVGRRGGPFALLTCTVAGDDEVCVTDAFDHIDGPDYTPDGQWIWFNAEREGAVNLWRIHPDGTGLQQMTDDNAVNWFPHPSPDGQHVVYLAYQAGTRGHPGGLDVALRLMPAVGGSSRLLTRLHGGQGTINVPCWAPDSARFAFMRYLA